ncbi:MAG TPA: calcium-translocating P-type ATPase, SERCA-type [bacterium]|nr:calcium-translocating P-type ATPase, SERCA-type [bacterium]HOL34642.1 calcium-translocating P-type ATPase, SERCA-type [bacterium]HPP08188.1 calcium-translocating P-type ATPase, SERCA-type [bacterium]
MVEKPWIYDTAEIAKQLDTDISRGLTEEEAKKRLAHFGYNKLAEKKKRHPIFLFFEQFRSFIIWILVIAAVIAGFLKEWVDTFAIIGIVILNSILGFIQEFKAEKSLEALKKLFTQYSRVLRNGQLQVVQSEFLVPGDIIELEAGDNIPADCRVMWHTTNFSVQEASLTGESTPVVKTSIPLNEPETIIAERANMVYMGTSVSSGRARCIVVDTGMRTELGKITEMIEDTSQEKTPLQTRLENFGKLLVYICLFLVGVIFLVEWVRGGKFIDVLLTAVSLAVAAIPEGLPAVVTIGLALGVQRMAKRNVLIRKLPSVETLGCATTICSDKTGTLTKNEMTVKKIYADGKIFTVTGAGYNPEGNFLINERPVMPEQFSGLDKSLLCAVVCNTAQLTKHNDVWEITGDPTEAALLTVAAKAGKWRQTIEKTFQIVDEIPFDSERKRMTVIVKHNHKLISFVKGAPDIILNKCSFIEENSTIKPLEEARKNLILDVTDSFARQSLRVIATGYKNIEPDSNISEQTAETDIVFTGLFAMIDPPREEAKFAIEKCKKAGIKVKMITGDHRSSAIAIAKQLSLIHNEDGVISGEQIDKFDDHRLKDIVNNVSVFARVSPHHKLRIVRALKKNHEIVAMTGDGVNDAPAVKEADIGIAMGITGTDVTKEVSDMVITDDNFASIVAAVEEGRGIYENIRKFVHYLLSCNAGEIMLMFFASFLKTPVPLLPIQILWINIVTDGLPALALGVDPVDPQNMEKPPRKPDEPIVNRKSGKTIILQGFFMAMCALGAFLYVIYIEKAGIEKARTMTFFVLSCSQLFHSFNLRSDIHSIFKLKFSTNMKLVYAVIFSFLLQISAIYLPAAKTIFRSVPIKGADLAFALIISSLPLWTMEIMKLMSRKKCSKS